MKINRKSGIAGANRTLAAMGIHDRVFAISNDQSAPRCVAEGHVPQPGPGVIIKVYGPALTNASNTSTAPTSTSPTSTSPTSTSTGDGWHAVACPS